MDRGKNERSIEPPSLQLETYIILIVAVCLFSVFWGDSFDPSVRCDFDGRQYFLIFIQVHTWHHTFCFE